jgi:glycosyltransferase involved in cell wall biosynthesis
MLVTNKLENAPIGGREMLCQMNHDVLKEAYGDRCLVFELEKSSIQGVGSIIGAFKGYIDGVTVATIEAGLDEIEKKEVTKIFVDGSNLGEFVRAVKKKCPEVEVCTFFHNVESRFFLGSLKQARTVKALAVLTVNYLAERKAVRYSDKIICLNERDSQLLERVYGRPATHISPMALRDKLLIDFSSRAREPSEKFAMFVGGVFYANQSGIAWFVKNVLPQINIKICIVGRGFEKFKDELEVDGKVEVIGEVESLAQWYRDAHFVIAPIFDGSGMKTKVAEALMFGKKIIGTPEAFTGYEEIADLAGLVCTSANEFVTAINSVDKIVHSSFDSVLRRIYEERYSYLAAKLRLEIIMNS